MGAGRILLFAGHDIGWIGTYWKGKRGPNGSDEWPLQGTFSPGCTCGVDRRLLPLGFYAGKGAPWEEKIRDCPR